MYNDRHNNHHYYYYYCELPSTRACSESERIDTFHTYCNNNYDTTAVHVYTLFFFHKNYFNLVNCLYKEYARTTYD